MQIVKVNVAPGIVDWVMRHAPTEKMSEQLLDELAKWKEGAKEPTFNQVESVSRTTQIPLGYFFLQTPPQESLPILEYRTVDSVGTENPSRNLIETIHYTQSVQEWMRDYLVGLGNDKLNYVASQKNNTVVDSIASNIRSTLGLRINWFTSSQNPEESYKIFRKHLETIGVLVLMSGIVGKNTHRPLDINEFRAFTLIDDYAPLIFINGNDSNGGKLFSLIHETAHIWVGVDSFYNDRNGSAESINPVETLCNAVAAELLVPNQLFIEQWARFAENDDLANIIRKLTAFFKCGTTVIARRAFDNRYINKQQYQALADEAVQLFIAYQNSKTQGGGNYYATNAIRLDSRFLIAVDNSVREGKTLYTDAYRLTNTSRKTFSNLVEKVRGGSDA
ncbi:ImmA/IrrE family metallo-endopeptidase [Ruminococcaceae bacterium OttesenSCG-928-A11]|nr:ImmA/IrrE family metallo-endopeptidase [Ruminococcaceae bacterium OttesenSCG-928-A11]